MEDDELLKEDDELSDDNIAELLEDVVKAEEPTYERNPILEKWDEIKYIMEVIEYDVLKNARGVRAAGLRSRKGLRLLKKRVIELIRISVYRHKNRIK